MRTVGGDATHGGVMRTGAALARWSLAALALAALAGCDNSPWETGASGKNTLFTAMQESSPRHMDPTASYWANDTTFTYQWNRDGVPISGATAVTYEAANADAGHKLSVTVTGDRYHFNDVTVTSAATKTIGGGVLVAPVPQIVGTPTRGATLTAVPGTW